MSEQDSAKVELPRDPYDALRLENDVLGVRLWGPPTQPTLSLGKSDIWDRRWFGDRQPLITLAGIRELAMADRLGELPQYDVYNKYDFPCPKPGAQVILGAPFARAVTVEPAANGGMQLVIEGEGKRLTALVWVALTRALVVMELRAEGPASGDLWVRVYRHRDTLVPGMPVSPTIGGQPSPNDFDQLAPPRCCGADRNWGIVQEFPAEATFPAGFRFAALATVIGADPVVECREMEQGLGTPLWGEREGRLSHGIVKNYAPINNATGAAATATFRGIPDSLTLLATIATTQDGPDPIAAAANALDEARRLGPEGLRAERAEALEQAWRKHPAQARLGEDIRLAAPAVVGPRLHRARGYYGDVPLCSVGSTKFCFQDSALWHDDFHLNEIRAEPMLTLGQFEELIPYCEMIRTLLDQARENAREVYDMPGAMYPLVHFPLRCRGVAHTNVTWEQDLGLNGLVTKPLWLHCRYTGDEAFLRETAYPVLSECARFSAAYLTREEGPCLHIVPTVSPEHWGLTPRFERNRDCLSALTLTRYLLLAAASAAEVLGRDREEAGSWRSAAGRLAGYPTYQTEAGPVWVDVAGAPPIEYNIPVPLAAIFWGDDVGLDSPQETLALARRTLDQIRVWEPHRPYLDSCVRPRLGIYRPGAPIGPENLLLSYQSIRLFPAVPPEVEIVMEDLAAQGGFRVSAVRAADGECREVRILSTVSGPCRLANPWPGRAVVVAASGDEIVRTSAAASHLELATQRGQVYELRPA